MTTRTFFFYGSLRDPALLELVLGRKPATRPAVLPGHRAVRVAGEAFPIAVPDPEADLDGVLVAVAPEELPRIVFFEDEEDFALRRIEVRSAAGAERAEMFAPNLAATREPWDFETWRREEQPFVLECAREIVALHERGADWSDPALWPGIKARARARLAAAAEPPRNGVAGHSRAEVETLRVNRPYASYFAVEEHHVRHPRFDGAMTPPLKRAVLASGDAVTVTPYDAIRDEVMLITQWRPGPHARGDARPWPVEAIAGRIDSPESPEAAARREAREEAGIELGRMVKIAAFYPSPGVIAEFVTAFVGEADLAGKGGVHGVESENEDILSLVLPVDEALAMVETFEANTSPLLVTLLWLAARRDGLRAAWSAPGGA